jgi:hypothetical protein
VVGDRDRGHAQLGDPLAELGESVGAVEEGVLTVEVKVYEVARHRTSIITRVEARSIGVAASVGAICW